MRTGVRCAGNPNYQFERRVIDLLSRMTVEEMVRQLDLYSGATALVDKHTDSTHARSGLWCPGIYTLWAGGSLKASLTTRFLLNP